MAEDSCCFDDWARGDLRRARRRGRPDRVSSRLLAALERAGIRDRTVLDVGCGAGSLVVGCVRSGASRGTGMDLAAGAVDAARILAEEQGVAARTRFVAADASVEPLDPHDVVALNRVICCYPDADNLTDHTLAAAGAVYAFVVPRSSGLQGRLNRAVLGGANLMFRLRRRRFGDYQAFVHDVDRIEARVEAAGFRPVARERVLFTWQLAVFARDA